MCPKVPFDSAASGFVARGGQEQKASLLEIAELRKARVHIALYLGLLTAHIALVWLLPFIPTQDGPSHLYNLVVLRDLLHNKGGWERFYSTRLQLVPNLGFPLVAYPLLSFLSPGAVERVFGTAYVLLLGVSVPVLLRTFGRPALPLSYFVFVVIFNKPFLMGFYSNALGVPLLLLAIALAWRVRHRSMSIRAVTFNVAALFLFVVHLLPFAIFLLAVALLALVEGGGWKERGRRLVLLALELSPSLLFAALLMSTDVGRPIRGWSVSPLQMLLELLFFAGSSFSPLQLVPGFTALLLFLAAATEGLKQLLRTSAESDGPAFASRFVAALCGALLIVYMVAPDWLFGGGFFKMRLPAVIVLVALPFLQPVTRNLSARHYARLMVLVASLAFVVNVALLWREGEQVRQFTCGLEANLPRGATLVSARFDVPEGWPPDPLLHAASYYGMRGLIDFGNYEAHQPHFLVRFRDGPPLSAAEQAYTRPNSVDWSRFAEVQFLLGWKAGKEDRARLTQNFALFWEKCGCPLTIWKRKHAPTN